MAKDKKTSVIDQILDQITPLEMNRHQQQMSLAAALDDLMKEKGISKVGLARLMHKEPSVITKWLSGTHNFQMDTLSEICFMLEVPLSILFKQDEKPLASSFGMAINYGAIEYQPILQSAFSAFQGVTTLGWLGNELHRSIFSSKITLRGDTTVEYIESGLLKAPVISKSSEEFYVITAENKLEKQIKDTAVKSKK